MMEELAELIRTFRGPEPLNPAKRARDFQASIQRARTGDYLEVYGFLLMREPPGSPKDAVYYLLSPLSPSELEKLPPESPRPYLVLRIDEKTSLSGELSSGSYVLARGILEPYPWGTLKMLIADEISSSDYSLHWTERSELALSQSEVESLIMDTVYANYDFEKALVYTFFAAPSIIGSRHAWGEGVYLSAFKREDKIALSVWETFKYLYSLLPWELRLKRNSWMELEDPALGIDFRVKDPNNSGLSYYVPQTKKILGREIPAPKWAEKIFKNKEAVFLESRGLLNPKDPLANLSETPFILTEPVGYDRNRELEELMPNLIATVFLQRRKVGSLNLGELETFRRRFEEWLSRNRLEYGEKFDALRLSGMVFETNTRYLLSSHLLGSMARFEGRLTRSLINDVLLINQELLDMWINELPAEVLMKLVKDYEKYISSDRRANLALSIFMDVEATSADGSVSREEFLRALVEHGFKKRDAESLMERLIREGYLYEPFRGKLKLIR